MLTNLATRDIETLVHPYTQLDAFRQTGPLVIERGQGVHLYDSSGKAYIEGLAGLWCTALGYGNEELVEAAATQMRKLPFSHLFGGKSHDPAIELAEKLKEIAPVPVSKVFFCNSGSEANDTQIKLVWYMNNALGRPKKKKIISRQKAYHGVTIASASLTGLPGNQIDFDLPIAGILHTSCPHHYRFAEAGEDEEAFSSRLADDLEQLIVVQGPDTVAAFIAEPVMGAGGVIVPPRGYFEKIMAVCEKYDVFMMYQAMLTESRKIGTFGHGYTYSGHPVAAAVALKTLEIYARDKIVEKVAAKAPQFQARFAKLAEHPLVGEARGVGLIGAVELVADKKSKRSFDPKLGVGARCVAFAQEEGLITRAVAGDNVALCPPLIISPEEIDGMFDMLTRALDQTLDWVTREKLAAKA